jgi:hypothetical protein
MPIARALGAYVFAGQGALLMAAFDGNLGRLKGSSNSAVNFPSSVQLFSRSQRGFPLPPPEIYPIYLQLVLAALLRLNVTNPRMQSDSLLPSAHIM